MIELKKRVNGIIADINDFWVEVLKKADESGEGVDLAEMFGSFSKKMGELDLCFAEAQVRLKNNNKKGFF